LIAGSISFLCKKSSIDRKMRANPVFLRVQREEGADFGAGEGI